MACNDRDADMAVGITGDVIFCSTVVDEWHGVVMMDLIK
jgi:hypothetical protein